MAGRTRIWTLGSGVDCLKAQDLSGISTIPDPFSSVRSRPLGARAEDSRDEWMSGGGFHALFPRAFSCFFLLLLLSTPASVSASSFKSGQVRSGRVTRVMSAGEVTEGVARRRTSQSSFHGRRLALGGYLSNSPPVAVLVQLARSGGLALLVQTSSLSCAKFEPCVERDLGWHSLSTVKSGSDLRLLASGRSWELELELNASARPVVECLSPSPGTEAQPVDFELEHEAFKSLAPLRSPLSS
ncbi:hypothetical protein C8Q74DRAFT_587228 [Fomes fomentarius]|nr:hypothetical protein C8Q74DRAFT_587228 [Fomes fomentarius]